ncbi:MAG: hypothetical protein ACLRIQ_20530 [Blautia wexlerae]
MTGITLEDCPKEEVKSSQCSICMGITRGWYVFGQRVIIDRFEKEGEWNEFCRKSIPPLSGKRKSDYLVWVLLITETMILSTVTILRVSEVARIELLGKSKAKLLIERKKRRNCLRMMNTKT